MMMALGDVHIRFIMLVMIRQAAAVSYNQPKFCHNASWNPNATTFGTNGATGYPPSAIFINTENTVAVTIKNPGLLFIWRNASANLITPINISHSKPWSLFITNADEIVVDGGSQSNQIDRWTLNGTRLSSPMSVQSECSGLFVDINNNLYCSQNSLHQVLRKSLNVTSSALTIVAGTGCTGSASHLLAHPRGIFVTQNLDLYVADSSNDRVQLFRSGELNGTTVVGSQASGTIVLNCPTAVVVDADGHLFITDQYNHRIVGSGPYGFRCVAGCSGTSGSGSDSLNNPSSLSFDRDGNIFVADQNNSRIQNFLLLNNICNATETTSSMNPVTSPIISSTPAINTNVYSPNARSFNQPKFCPNASWNPNATTFANNSIIGSAPHTIFINTMNTIIAVRRDNGHILVWSNGSANPTTTLLTNASTPLSLFVTTAGEIFVDDGSSKNQVDRWSLNGAALSSPMSVCSECFGLFVDILNNLYCSQDLLHKVVKKSLNDPSMTLTIAAGTGCNGSATNMLKYPNGIFVDNNLNLYVADWGNDRVQSFRSGELNGTTVAGSGSSSAFTLDGPTAVVLDADGYLFIVDHSRHRIVGSGPYGFRCIVGCTGSSGSASNQLLHPRALSFDSDGNIFVADRDNDRIQKFFLINNSCAAATTLPSTIKSEKISSTSPVQSSKRLTMSAVTSTSTGRVRSSERLMTSAEASISTSHGQSSEPLEMNVVTSTLMVPYVSNTFIPPNCSNTTMMGAYCNISAKPCELLDPCQNGGKCRNTNTTLYDRGYICLCENGFNGTHCELDQRPCHSQLCWNGVCNATWNHTFYCNCSKDWEGEHCERKVDYCQSAVCQNNGVCRPVLGDYQCDCLGDSYSGRNCEIKSQKLVANELASKSLGYIAIIALVIVATFIVTMDMLKYVFGIDPARKERKRLRQQKQPRKRRPLLIQRFIYVNPPVLTLLNEETPVNRETTV